MESFLKEKISQIKDCVEKREKQKALNLIDEVLEFAPGWEIGDKIKQSGEIHFLKLLVETDCKNEEELLCSGKILKGNPSFENAKKYANENENLKYKKVEQAKDLIVKRLMEEFDRKEPQDKYATGVKEKLPEFKQKMSDLQKLTQENIIRLEEKEKEIHEQVIDCEIVAGENKLALENLRSKAKTISEYHKTEISKEEKDDWEAQLELIEIDNSMELNKLEQLKSSNPKFLEFFDLVKEQQSICGEIRKNKNDLQGLNSEMGKLVSSVEKITKDYAEARTNVNNGSYDSAKRLITQERFEEIVKQSFEGK